MPDERQELLLARAMDRIMRGIFRWAVPALYATCLAAFLLVEVEAYRERLLAEDVAAAIRQGIWKPGTHEIGSADLQALHQVLGDHLGGTVELGAPPGNPARKCFWLPLKPQVGLHLYVECEGEANQVKDILLWPVLPARGPGSSESEAERVKNILLMNAGSQLGISLEDPRADLPGPNWERVYTIALFCTLFSLIWFWATRALLSSITIVRILEAIIAVLPLYVFRPWLALECLLTRL